LSYSKTKSIHSGFQKKLTYQKNRLDYKSLTDNEKFIFTSNLKYQILLDSIQSRGIPNLTEDLSES
jgi:ribonucleotide reductase beta subunit family protein with ferritin-like domain